MPFPFLLTTEEPVTHALVVTPLKHYYLQKNGAVKWQQSKRSAGTKRGQSIRLYLACDRWSGAAFGELQPVEEDINLLGFLTRAWWESKPWTSFSGLPDRLVVNRQLQQAPELVQQWRVLEQRLGLVPDRPDSFPPWYASSVHRYEGALSSVLWQWKARVLQLPPESPSLTPLDLDELGALATISVSNRCCTRWQESESPRPQRALPDEWLAFVDRCHEPYASWRHRLHLDWPVLEP